MADRIEWRWHTSNSLRRLTRYVNGEYKQDGDVLHAYRCSDGMADISVKERDMALISSAPDMAEALKPFVDFIDILEIIRPGRDDNKEFLEISVADDTKLVITFGDFRRAREAFSKATGGSNG